MADTLSLDSPAPGVTRVTLNRPATMNALNTRMGEDLREAFESLTSVDAGTLRAVILTGAGDRAFCAGADLKERDGMTEAAWRAQHLVFEEAARAIASCPAPVVAAVNGVALGGGCELALACDFIIAADTARFGQPEVMRGLMPGLGGTQRLPRRIGIARARELLFTGRLVGGDEALRWGLVNRVVPAGDLAATALDVAQMIAANAPLAVRAVKRAVDEGADRPLDAALGIEMQHYDGIVDTDDRREGVRAFAEKRPPRFTAT